MEGLIWPVLFTETIHVQDPTTFPALPPDPPPSSSPQSLASMNEVLRISGWPPELWQQAREIAWCESRWHADSVGDGGASLGLWQLWTGWFAYAEEDVEQWADPVVNSRVALAVYRYDLARGQAPWSQWSCRPMLLGYPGG